MARRPRVPSMRFTRLKLTNWRNFRSVDIELQIRAFILGPNASGKSNLLDAIRFLSEIARPGSGGLQAAIASRGGFSAIRCLQARAPSHVAIEAWVGDDEHPERWHYLLRMNTFKKERLPTVIEEFVEYEAQRIDGRIRSEADDALEFSQTMLEQVTKSKSFRGLTDFLSSCRYLHVVPQIVRDRNRARSEGEDPYGGDLLRRVKEMPRKTRDPRLRRISEALRIAVPQFREIELEDDNEGIPHLLASYVHWRSSAVKQSEAQFSDGTLRLIGLLWSIAEGGGPLLLEEPELSLNDAVVSQLPRMFTRMQRLSARQVITTTHSTTLIDDSSIGLKEVHRISVDANGSTVETTSKDRVISAQVDNGMRISEAVLPLLRPREVEQLGKLDVAA